MKHKTIQHGWHVYIKSVLSFLGIVVAVAGLFGPSSVLAEPAISSVQASQITASSAVISWYTDVPSDSYISYVGADDSEAQLASDDTLVTNHQVTLTGLKANTVYSFAVNSADAQGDNAAQNGIDFTTLSVGGGTPTPTPTPVPVPTPTPAPVPTPTPTPTTSPDQGGGLTVPTGLQYQPPVVIVPVYPTATLARENGTIYFLMGKDGVKIPFTTMDAFAGLGYKLSDVQDLDLSAFRLPVTYFLENSVQQHPWGSIVEKGGVLYYSHISGMIPIPSMDVFTANGFTSTMIVHMNSADEEVLQNYPVMYPLEINDDRIM